MAEYKVTWVIDLDADDPWQAAERALEIHRNPASIATVFTCQTDGLEPVEIDLTEGTVDGASVHYGDDCTGD